MKIEKIYPKNSQEFETMFKPECPKNFNFVFDVFDEIANREPEKIALIHVDNEGIKKELSFAELQEASIRLADSLQKNGLKKGDKAMLILYRRIEFWVTMLAMHRIGVLPIPSPSLLTEHDIETRAAYAGITTFIVEDSIAERIDKALAGKEHLTIVAGKKTAGTLFFDELIEAGDKNFKADYEVGGEDPLLIFFSSGTTGMPKMVLHNHYYAMGHLTTGLYWHNLEKNDIHLTLSDTGWGKALWGKFYGQWMAESAVFVWDFRDKFDAKLLLDIISNHQITTFCAPPTVYRFLIMEDIAKWNLSNLRHCTTAGELLNDSVFDTWKKITGLSIREGYGQTETCLQIATFPWMEAKPGSIGKAVPGWEIELLNANGEICENGEEGEICVRLHSADKNNGVLGLFDSYLYEPEKTAVAKIDGYYHTGDKAWKDEDDYFWFLGRIDDLIKSSGYRVGPFEVESALITHPAVVEAAVTGVPDPVRGQAIKATITLRKGFEPTEELKKEIQNHVKKVTAPYKYPRIIEFVSELPKTISGKIQRKKIRDADAIKYAEKNK